MVHRKFNEKFYNKVYFGASITFDQFEIYLKSKLMHVAKPLPIELMENHTVLSFKEVNCKRSHKVPSRAFNSAFWLNME